MTQLEEAREKLNREFDDLARDITRRLILSGLSPTEAMRILVEYSKKTAEICKADIKEALK